MTRGRRAVSSTLLVAGLVALLAFGLAAVAPASTILNLDQAGIVLGFVLSCLTAASAAIAFFYRPALQRLFRRWRDRRAFEGVGVRLAEVGAGIDAMVIPVSRYEQPAWILHHLRPQRVALLCTEAKRQWALDLIDEFGTDVVFDPPREALERGMDLLEEPFDPDACRRMARHLIDRLLAAGIPRQRIFADTTGGTVPMSIGVFQAAEETGVSSIYVIGQAIRGEQSGLILEPREPSEGVPQFISNHTAG